MGLFKAVGSVVNAVAKPISQIPVVGGLVGGILGGIGGSLTGETAKQEQANMAQQFAQWRNYAAVNAPQYSSILNPEMSDWREGVNTKVGFNYDPQYFNQMADYASSTEDSPWLQLMKSRLEEQKLQNVSDIMQQSAAAQAGAREQLGMRRGLSSGAAERIATQGSLGGMFARQQAAQDFGGRMQEAAIEEARQKQGTMLQLPQFELQRAQTQAGVEQQNIANLLNERAAQQKYAMDQYMTNMGVFGSEHQANAMMAAGAPQGINKLFGIF